MTYFLLGVGLSGPFWIAGTWLIARRILRGAKRIARRARGREHYAQIGELVGGLAHEMKNPLSTINLNLRLLAEDLERYHDEQHQRLLRRLTHVRQEADRVRETLDDFLRFAGKYELQPTATDLNTLVGELADFFSPQADAAGVVMRTSLSPEPVRCELDPKLIKQAVLNLLINAVQAMTEGGELLLSVRSERSRGVIEVTDTGKGMDEQTRERMFDIYYSTKSGGSGLGLPTTRRIIQEHHGSIQVDSEPGRGTRFTIRLPDCNE